MTMVINTSPAVSSIERPRQEALSVQQSVESLYQNGLRNAQRHNDVYGQIRSLEKALASIKELRASSPLQTSWQERRMNRRCRQLRKMISKGSPVETL